MSPARWRSSPARPAPSARLPRKVLAGAGAKVVLVAGGKKALDEVAAACRELGAEVEALNRRGDSEAACAAIVEAAVKRFGRSTSWSSPRARTRSHKIVDMKPETFLDIMDVNVTQSWLMARAAGAQMLEQGEGGKVVLMSSARGLLGHPAGYTAYCASKSAIDGITKALGCEWGPSGITVNAIAPTVFRSPLTAWMFEDTETRRDGAEGLPRPRAEGPPRRAGGPRRSAPLPRLAGVGLLHRPHPLRRRRLHGGVRGCHAPHPPSCHPRASGYPVPPTSAHRTRR